MFITKRLLLLMLIVLVSLTASSKSVTSSSITQTRDTIPVVVIPQNVGREVAKDLIRKDSLEDELRISKSNNDLLTNNSIAKDSIIRILSGEITLYKAKEANYELIGSLKDEKYGNLKLVTDKLNKDLKKEKRKLITTKVGAGVIITFLGYLLIKG